MRRRFVKFASMAVAIIMLAALALTGCSGAGADTGKEQSAAAANETQAAASTQAEQPKENVKLTFWHTYGDVEDPFFNDTVLPLFKEKFPYIEIESVKQESSQFNQLIVAAFGTKQTPDIARIELTNVASYANQGGLVSLDEMEGFGDLKGQVLEGPLSTNLFKGKYYGLPLDANCKAAVVNMDVMQSLGFTEVPKTMEELIDAAKAKSPGKYVLNTSGVGDWDTYTYFWLFGGRLTDENFTKATGYMDSPESIAALQKMIDLHSEKVFTIKDVDGTADAWAGIQDKTYGMFFEGPWFFSANSGYADKKITPAVIPTFNGKSASVVGGEDIVIFSNTAHPKEAFEFVKFMLSEQVQMMMASRGQMPVLKSAVEKDQIKKDPVYSIYQKQLESARTRIPSPQNTAINQAWSDALNKALRGEATAEAALKEAAAKIDAELAK